MKSVLPDPDAPVDLSLASTAPVAQQKTEKAPLASADIRLAKPTAQMLNPAPVVQEGAVPSPSTGMRRSLLPDVLEEALVHRVMQRVDIALDQRVCDAIANVVQQQTRSLTPRLREEIESVVRQVVSEAVTNEVAVGAVHK